MVNEWARITVIDDTYVSSSFPGGGTNWTSDDVLSSSAPYFRIGGEVYRLRLQVV